MTAEENTNNRGRTNVSNRLYGRYQAEVVNTVHPDHLYLVTVRLLALWDAIPDKDLPYAEFMLPLGAKPDHGHAVPVEKGDLVWVEFPRNGDTRYPLIMGSVYHAPNSRSNLPPEVNQEAYSPKRAKGEPMPPAYDRKDDLYSRFGLRELRTHTGGWSITHLATGTAIEITPDGQVVIHAEADQWRSGTGNLTEQIAKDVILDVGGGKKVTIGKDLIIKAENIHEEATMITLNKGKGVVTGECICAFTGKPHMDISSTVTAGK